MDVEEVCFIQRPSGSGLVRKCAAAEQSVQ